MTELIEHETESWRDAKPDRIETEIADRIAGILLDKDPNARFDLRVNGSFQNGNPHVRVSGEVTRHLLTPGIHDGIAEIVLGTYNRVHRTELSSDKITSDSSLLKPQEPALAQNTKAGDSGSPIGVAYKSAPHFLPWDRYLAVGIRQLIDYIFQNNGKVPSNIAETSGITTVEGLRADGKISVAALYSKARLDSLRSITLALQHEPGKLEDLQRGVESIVNAYLDNVSSEYGITFGDVGVNINRGGEFVEGGWKVDEGNREAKPQNEAFGTHGVLEDALTGEDSSKPSRTGTLIARYIAVQVVANGLAEYARVKLTYEHGTDNVGLNIWTNGTGTVSQEQLHEIIRNSHEQGLLPLTIQEGIEKFDLKNPEIYREIARTGDHFQDSRYTWNRKGELYVPKRKVVAAIPTLPGTRMGCARPSPDSTPVAAAVSKAKTPDQDKTNYYGPSCY